MQQHGKIYAHEYGWNAKFEVLMAEIVVQFAQMVLWTHSRLGVARDIYARRGFLLVNSAPYRGFGQDLAGETWELKL